MRINAAPLHCRPDGHHRAVQGGRRHAAPAPLADGQLQAEWQELLHVHRHGASGGQEGQHCAGHQQLGFQ